MGGHEPLDLLAAKGLVLGDSGTLEDLWQHEHGHIARTPSQREATFSTRPSSPLG